MALAVEEKLHKGPGVRRDDLSSFLTQPFADRLHIFEDDSAKTVLAKVIWQVSAIIRRIPAETKWVTALEAMYNLPQDPELNAKDLSGRLRVLERRHGAGWNPSTINTKLSELRSAYMYPALKDRLPWAPEEQIDAIARSEERYAARDGASRDQIFVLPEDTFGLLIAERSHTGRLGLERALPQAALHFAVSAKGNLVTTATVEFGETLATFTNGSLLAHYREQWRAPATDRPTVAAGRLVVDALVAHGRIGLAVNPLGGHGAHGGLHWTAQELVSL